MHHAVAHLIMSAGKAMGIGVVTSRSCVQKHSPKPLNPKATSSLHMCMNWSTSDDQILPPTAMRTSRAMMRIQGPRQKISLREPRNREKACRTVSTHAITLVNAGGDPESAQSKKRGVRLAKTPSRHHQLQARISSSLSNPKSRSPAHRPTIPPFQTCHAIR